MLVYYILSALVGAAIALAVYILVHKASLKGKKEEILPELLRSSTPATCNRLSD